jgi:hypothetical protein
MAALAVMTGITLLASACGGNSSSAPDGSSSPGSSAIPKNIAFANCMRQHGIPISVAGNGNVSSGSGGGGSGSSQQFLSAQNACRHLLPNGGQPSQGQQQSNIKQALKYAQCMRSHGVPKFPDPSSNGSGPVGFSVPAGSGINPQSPTYQKANQACQSTMSGSAP